MNKSVILIVGDDEYRVSAKAKAVVDDVVPPGEQSLSLDVVAGDVESADAAVAAVGKCMEALSTVSLFSAARLTWLRDASFLSDTRLGGAKEVKAQVNALAELIRKGLPSDQVFLVTAPRVDKRYAFFKACKSVGDIHEFVIPDKSWQAEPEARARLQEGLRSARLKMDQQSMAAFLAKVGTDTRQIMNEVEKLKVFVGDRREVKLADVRSVTSASRSAVAWDLSDAVGWRDLQRSLTILRQLLFQRTSPIAVMMAIQTRVRDLMVYREALDRGWLTERRTRQGKTWQWGQVPPRAAAVFSEQFTRDPRSVHPFRAGVLAGQAEHFSRRELQVFRERATETHRKLVTTSLPSQVLLECLLIAMLPRGPHAQPRPGT